MDSLLTDPPLSSVFFSVFVIESLVGTTPRCSCNVAHKLGCATASGSRSHLHALPRRTVRRRAYGGLTFQKASFIWYPCSPFVVNGTSSTVFPLAVTVTVTVNSAPTLKFRPLTAASAAWEDMSGIEGAACESTPLRRVWRVSVRWCRHRLVGVLHCQPLGVRCRPTCGCIACGCV